jgi:thioredoxin 1
MIHLTNDNIDQTIKEINETGKFVFVDMYADWCGPCKKIEPIINELDTEYNGKVVFVKVNVDENPESVAKYNVRSIPTLMIFDTSGNVVKQFIGVLPKNQINEMIKNNT